MKTRTKPKPRRKTRPTPKDELLLAAALAAANARGLGHCIGARFKDSSYLATTPDQAVQCCVLGALELAGVISPTGVITPTGMLPSELVLEALGNDCKWSWSDFDADRGESLGWAFREAMTS